jgi:hypothetical protein
MTERLYQGFNGDDEVISSGLVTVNPDMFHRLSTELTQHLGHSEQTARAFLSSRGIVDSKSSISPKLSLQEITEYVDRAMDIDYELPIVDSRYVGKSTILIDPVVRTVVSMMYISTDSETGYKFKGPSIARFIVSSPQLCRRIGGVIYMENIKWDVMRAREMGLYPPIGSRTINLDPQYAKTLDLRISRQGILMPSAVGSIDEEDKPHKALSERLKRSLGKAYIRTVRNMPAKASIRAVVEELNTLEFENLEYAEVLWSKAFNSLREERQSI